MKTIARALAFLLNIALVAEPAMAGKTVLTARVWLFQASYMEGQPMPAELRILPISATPELASLQALSDGPEDEFKAAIMNAILESDNLRSLADLFYSKDVQYGDSGSSNRIFLGRQVAYRLGLSHKILDPARAALRITITRTKDGVLGPEKDDRTMLRKAYEASLADDKMSVIVDQQLAIGFADPVVIAVPHDRQSYYLVVKLTANEPEPPRRRASPTLKLPPISSLVPAPRPTGKVLPSYPDELRRRGIKGDVGLLLGIDEKGQVRMVQVSSPLHPYLDYTASQAFWEWRFEPVLKSGKPVPAAFELSFTFSPEAYAQEMTSIDEPPAAADSGAQEELEAILGSCAEYSRKLRDAGLFYICEETIKETRHALVSSDRLAELALRSRDTAFQVAESADGQMTGLVVEKPQIMSIRDVDRLSYSCDYQMIRRFGEIEERRIMLKENGRRIADRVELLEEGRYAALSPIVSALSILAETRQPLFHFRILKEDKVSGRGALIIEALPKLGDADGVLSAKVWLEKGSGRILRCEIEGVPLDGYDDILAEAVLLNIKPHFVRTYEYRTEHQGLLLPGQTSVRIEYPSLMRNRRETKSKIELSYRDFKFFSVETGHEVIR